MNECSSHMQSNTGDLPDSEHAPLCELRAGIELQNLRFVASYKFSLVTYPLKGVYCSRA